MSYIYEYDFTRDYQQPSKTVLVANCIIGICLFLFGLSQILRFVNNEKILYLLMAVISLIGGIAFLLYVLNGSKPLINTQEYFLKIDADKIYYRWGKASKSMAITINQIKKVSITDRDIHIRLKDSSEKWITLSKIQNDNKRQELKQYFHELINRLN